MRLKLICCLGTLLFSHSVMALSLDEAILSALEYEDQLKLSALQIEQQKAALKQAESTFGLDVNLVGQLGREKIDAHKGTMFPTEGIRTMRGAQLQFDYPVYTWGRKQLAIQAAELQLSAQHQAMSGQRATTVLQVVRTYTDVLKQKVLSILQEKTNSNLERSLYEAEKRFSAGIITRADLAQAQAQYAQGLADDVTAKSNLSISQARFFQITGLQAKDLDNIYNAPIITESLLESLAFVDTHPAILQAKLQQAAAQRQYELTSKELKPMLTLTSNIGSQDEVNSLNSESENYTVALQISIPIFDHGVNTANRQKASVDRLIAGQQVDTLRNNLIREIQSSYAQLDAVRQNKQALAEATKSAAIALTYIHKELEVGTKTTFDLLTAEQKLLELETQQVINKQDEVVLSYQILDQTGRIESRVIAQVQQQEKP